MHTIRIRRRADGWSRVPLWSVGTALVAVIAALGLLASPGSSASGSRANIRPVQLQLSADDKASWQRQIATPEGRAQVVSEMQLAFANVATIGVGTSPATSDEFSGRIRNVASISDLRPTVEWGITADHFWIIVSYADIANGAIWAAVRACQARLPGWLCTNAGNMLVNWAQGWGSASNHGVWAEVYWWPPRITGGRW
jgi:hypothetical protein